MGLDNCLNEAVRGTLAHLYAAEGAWHLRWQGTSPTALLPADQFPDLASLRKQWTEHDPNMCVFLESLGEDGLTRTFEYKLFSAR